MAMADARGDAARLRRAARRRSSSRLSRVRSRSAEFLARPDDDLGVSRLELEHVQRHAGREAQALALADREPMDAAVPAEHASRRVDDLARRAARSPSCRSTKPAGVAVRHEADLVAVGLVGDGEARAARACARTSGFVRWPTGNTRVRELVLRQREQEIRLVLVRVDAAQQPIPAPVLVEGDARVVAGGDRGGVERRRRARPASRTSGRRCSARTESACGRRRTRRRSCATTVSLELAPRN